MFAFLWERNREKGGRRGHRDMGKPRFGQVFDCMTTASEALSLPAYRLGQHQTKDRLLKLLNRA
jgi:hypothetical protein